MGVDSPVAGKAGAVRIQRVGGVALSAAEAHGKRLDATGRGRVVREAEALSTTGLDLNRLYDAHVEGAKVQKSATKALHMVVQFPTELVDPDDAELMLSHARSFAEEVFGTSAIFADRVDRDEKGRHVVDLFIAPKYEKQTKRTTQTAISTSRDLKALAVRRGRAPSLRGQGQALQDVWHEYLRDRMKLAVQRGEPKKRPGPDWQSAEALEVERLKRLSEKLGSERKALESRRAYLEDRIIQTVREQQKYQALAQEALEVTRTARKDAETATIAAKRLENLIPDELSKGFARFRTLARRAFKDLGWMGQDNRFTQNAGLSSSDLDEMHLVARAIDNIAAVHESSEAVKVAEVDAKRIERADYVEIYGAAEVMSALWVAEKSESESEIENDEPDYDSGPSGP